MITPPKAVIRCKTAAEARRWMAAIPQGCAALTGNTVQIIKPLEVTFSLPPNGPAKL